MGFSGAALVLAAVASTASAGSSAYSSRVEATASKKTAQTLAQSQEKIASQEIAAAKEGEVLASEAAKNKLKLRRASQTKTILTSPLGVDAEESQVNRPTLGV